MSAKTFDAATIRSMRAALDAGASPRRLALLHGVSTETVRRIGRRETYVGPEWEPEWGTVKEAPPVQVEESLRRLQDLLKED